MGEEGVLRIALRMKGRELKAVARGIGRAVGGLFRFPWKALCFIYHLVIGAPRAFARAVRGLGHLMRGAPGVISKVWASRFVILLCLMAAIIPSATFWLVGWAWFVSGLPLILKVIATIGAAITVWIDWNLIAAAAVKRGVYDERGALWNAGGLTLGLGGMASIIMTVIAALLGFLDPSLTAHWQWACVTFIGGVVMVMTPPLLDSFS